MNDVKGTLTVEKEQNTQYEAVLREQKALIAEKRKRRRRKKQFINMITICMILLFACIWAIAFISTKEKGVSSEDSGENFGNTVIPDDVLEINELSPYRDIPYYKEENEDRYNAYAELNPEMAKEDVVWRVNAYQDKIKYEYDVETSGYDDPTIIVNKYYKVPEGYKPPDLQQFDGQYLRKDTGEAYKKMRDDARLAGYRIRVVSGYRSVEYQKNLYNSYLATDTKENVDRYSARPGYSEHHTGMAMDIFGSRDGLREFENTPEYEWVRDNCYKYGFIIRYLKEAEDITGYDAEPWHLRYVGVEISTDMKEKDINSLEEYHAKYLTVE